MAEAHTAIEPQRHQVSVPRSRITVLLSVSLLAICWNAGAAQDASNTRLTTCTLIGCGPDSFAIDLRTANGKSPTTLPDITLEVDGQVVRCSGLVPDLKELYGPRCGGQADVRLSIEPAVDCDAEGKCVLTGKNAVRILVIGTPKTVHVAMTGSSSEHATFEPKYEDYFPNGPNCPPPCRRARAVWTINNGW